MAHGTPMRLDFDAAASDPAPAESHASPSRLRVCERTTVATIFGEEEELPPTWSEASEIFHTWAKCTRLHAIRRNRRVTGNPGLREHCLNCRAIAATRRRG